MCPCVFLAASLRYCVIVYQVYLAFPQYNPLRCPRWPGTHSIDKASFKLKDPPASTSGLLGFIVWTTTASLEKKMKRDWEKSLGF